MTMAFAGGGTTKTPTHPVGLVGVVKVLLPEAKLRDCTMGSLAPVIMIGPKPTLPQARVTFAELCKVRIIVHSPCHIPATNLIAKITTNATTITQNTWMSQ